jgi:hypothetical protein
LPEIKKLSDIKTWNTETNSYNSVKPKSDPLWLFDN